MPTPDAHLFSATVSEAAGRGRAMMSALVERASVAMRQRGAQAVDPIEATALAQAGRELQRNEPLLCSLYPQALLKAFNEPVGAAASNKPAAAFSFDALELMGEEQVQESVELARAQSATIEAVESVLPELNALVCASQGLKTVSPERNPLRPEVYVRTLRAVLGQADASPAVRLRWMQHMGEALGPELRDVYQSLCINLKAQGVTAAGYAVIHSVDTGHTGAERNGTPGRADAGGGGGGNAGGGGGGGGGNAGGAGTPRQRDEVLLTVSQLRRLLAGELDGSNESFASRFAREFESTEREFPKHDFSPTVPAAFEALQEMNKVDQVMQRLEQRRKDEVAAAKVLAARGAAPAQPLGSVREQMRRSAQGVGQTLGLEVVNLMVDNIASDKRLLAPVQQAVRALEPALLRLALIDPRFFSDKQHPARRLLEQMTQRSMAWETVDAPGFTAFFESLMQAVSALSAAKIGGAEPFEIALRTLEEAWAEQQKREQRRREKAMRSLLRAEQRNLLAEKVAREIRARPDTAVAPRDVVNFLCGPWSQVIAQARLTDKTVSTDPGGYSALVTDLIWSALPELARNNPARLAQIIPGMLEKLRAGLASIDFPLAKAMPFFNVLMGLHEQTLKPQPPAPAVAARLTREELDARFNDSEDTDRDALWLAPSEAQNSGFMETRHEEPATRPAFQNTQPAFSDTQPPGEEPAAPQARTDGIPVGAFVELLVQGRATRSQMTWASPHGTLFMFTSADGNTYSMTRRSLDRMLADGSLRVVSDHAVVDQALDAVAQAAMRNSVDFTL